MALLTKRRAKPLAVTSFALLLLTLRAAAGCGTPPTAGDSGAPPETPRADAQTDSAIPVSRDASTPTESGPTDAAGTSDSSELGDVATGDASPVAPPGPWDLLSSNYSHTCATTTNGGLYCWGSNFYGELGLRPRGVGTEKNKPNLVPSFPPVGQRIRLLATRFSVTCAVLSPSEELYCWGENSGGYLGVGTNPGFNPEFASVTTPTRISGFPSGQTIASLTLGFWYGCAKLSPSGSLSCWGRTEWSDTTYPPSQAPHEVPNFPPPGTTIQEVVTPGDTEACARVAPTNQVFCWSKATGGLDSAPLPMTAPAIVPDTSVALLSSSGLSRVCAQLVPSGSIGCWWTNKIVQRVQPVLPAGATVERMRVSGGSNVSSTHVCYVASSNAIYCWGDNSNGELGLGPGAPFAVSTPTPIPSFPPAGQRPELQDACTILRPSNRIYCWGKNYSGVAGVGTTTAVLSPTEVLPPP